MRLSLARVEVDIILKLLETEMHKVSPGVKHYDNVMVLKHKFLSFRNQVWDSPTKEV